MNKSSKVNAFLLAMMVGMTAPARGMDCQAEVLTEQQAEVSSSEQAPVVWYKKRETQVSIGILALAAAYAIAVRMDKIASPAALVAMLFCSKVVGVVASDNTNITHGENNIPETNVPAAGADALNNGSIVADAKTQINQGGVTLQVPADNTVQRTFAQQLKEAISSFGLQKLLYGEDAQEYTDEKATKDLFVNPYNN